MSDYIFPAHYRRRQNGNLVYHDSEYVGDSVMTAALAECDVCRKVIYSMGGGGGFVCLECGVKELAL